MGRLISNEHRHLSGRADGNTSRLDIDQLKRNRRLMQSISFDWKLGVHWLNTTCVSKANFIQHHQSVLLVSSMINHLSCGTVCERLFILFRVGTQLEPG